MRAAMPFDVFVSHSSKDKEITRRIHDALTAAGIETWVDFIDIHDGNVWDANIQEALNNAKRGVIVLSRASMESTHCRGEWQTLITRKLPLFVLKVEALADGDIPYYLKPTQLTDLTRDIEIRLTALIANMTGIIANTSTPSYAKKISGGFPRWHLDIPLHGREDDLGKVRAVLDAENTRHMVQITGIGGVGKTRLAAEVANLADYVNGVIWHDCRIGTLSGLAATIREHLGLSVTLDEQTWMELDKYTLLMVLDNGEDCSEPAAYSEVINRLSNNVRILLTTRLRWQDLKRTTEVSLTQPDLVVASQIMREFAEKEASKEIADTATTLAKAAYRHPRLMEVVASWLRDKSVVEVLEELRSLTSSDAKDALEEMIVRSVERVKNGENGEMAFSALQKLAVCRGGFTSEAAKAIAGEYEFAKALKPLRNWGLLRFEGDRYEIDPLVIETIKEDKQAHRAHLDYYQTLVQQHTEKQDYLGLDSDSANLEAAFEWAIEIGDGALAYWFAYACENFQRNRGRFGQQMAWLIRLEPLMTAQIDNWTRAAFMGSQGGAYWSYPFGQHGENLRRAIAAYEQTLQFWASDTAPLDYAGAQNNLGTVYQGLARVEERETNLSRAITAYEQALRFWTPETAPLDYAMTQNNLGNAYVELARVEKREENLRRAITAYEQTLRFWRQETAPLDYAVTQNNLGEAYSDLAEVEEREKNLQRAIMAFKEALRLLSPENAPLDYAETLHGLGIAHKKNGDSKAAIQCWCEAEKYYREMGYIENADKTVQAVMESGGSCE